MSIVMPFVMPASCHMRLMPASCHMRQPRVMARLPLLLLVASLHYARSTFTVTSGTSYCSTTNGGTCVTDGPGNYGNYERCTIVANSAM